PRRLGRGTASAATYKAFPPQSQEVEDELRGGDEQHDDEEQRDGSSPQLRETPARTEVRADEDDRHQDRDQDELRGPSEAPGTEGQVDHVGGETDRRRRDDQQRRRPDRLPSLSAEDIDKKWNVQQARSEEHTSELQS